MSFDQWAKRVYNFSINFDVRTARWVNDALNTLRSDLAEMYGRQVAPVDAARYVIFSVEA